MSALQFERIWPYGGAGVCLLLWLLTPLDLPSDRSGLMGASATVASVLVGFLATAQSIVLSISKTRVYAKIKETGYIDILFRYLTSSIYSGIAFLAICVIGFFVSTRPWIVWFSDVWVLAGSLMLLLYIRITGLLFQLLKQA